MGSEDVSIDTLLGRLEDFMQDDVDQEVEECYKNILLTRTLAPVQTAFLASVYQSVLADGLARHRQLLRETISMGLGFKGTLRCTVMEIRDLDVTEQLGADFDGTPFLSLRLYVEGNGKATTKAAVPRVMDGAFETARINQDLDFVVTKPTSLVHMDLVHIDDDQPNDAPTREALLGSLRIPLRALESQVATRQWFPARFHGKQVAEVRMRMHYVFRENQLSKWDTAAGMPRAEADGGPSFTVGVIGCGALGRRVETSTSPACPISTG